MPLFEFSCLACAKKFTFLSGVVAGNADPVCPRCGSLELKKLISRVSRGRSDDDRLDEMADKMDQKNLEDPAQLRRFAREMGKEVGAETGDDMSEELEQLIEAEAAQEGEPEAGLGSPLVGKDDGTIY